MIPRKMFDPLFRVSKKIRHLVIALGVLSATSLFGFGILVYKISQNEHNFNQGVSAEQITPENVSDYDNVHGGVNLNQVSTLFGAMTQNASLQADAYYAVAWDTKQNLFYELTSHNADTAYNAASLTKLITALTISKTSTRNIFVDTSAETGHPEDEPGNNNLPSSVFTQNDLLAAMLIQSSNKSAYALADTVANKRDFIQMMNTEAKKIGLSKSILRDPSGLDDRNPKKASYMSPRDVARVAFELVSRYPYMTELSTHFRYPIETKKGDQFVLRNTNPLVATSKNVLLSKTGYTLLAGGNMTMVIEPKPGIWVALVVMKSTLPERANDMQQLLTITNASFQTLDTLALHKP